MELWKSDGTLNSTELVKDIQSGSNGSSPSELTVYNSKLYFAANGGADGNELWVSGGDGRLHRACRGYPQFR